MNKDTEAFREDARFKIIRVLDAHPDYSQRDIARELGISLGIVNFCLKALVSKGHVKVTNFRQSDKKLRYVYALTPSGLSERATLTSRFLQRKIQEFEAIRAEINMLTGEMANQPSVAGNEPEAT